MGKMNWKFVAKAAVAGLALIAGAAQATIVFDSGAAPANLTDNVLFTNSCASTITGPATLLQGCLNQQNNVLVNLQGNENLRISQGNGGQASILSAEQDGVFNYLKIFLNPLQTSLFDILAFAVDTRANGNITLNAENTLGQFFTQTFSLKKNGENKFLTTAIDGQNIRFVELTTNVGIADVKLVRIGGAGAEVPEPASLSLAGLALLAAVGMRRRKARA